MQRQFRRNIKSDFAGFLWTNQQWDLTFDTKNQFLDPKLVEFGVLNIKIG
jgi:hypothetical protein